jgi:hypothetical protein
LAARAAAIFCANLDSGLAGLPVSEDGSGEEGFAGVGLSGACLEAAAERLCSASIANFDLGFAPSVDDGPRLAPPEAEAPEGAGTLPLVLAGLWRESDNRCKAERGSSGVSSFCRFTVRRRGSCSGVGTSSAGGVASPEDELSRDSIGANESRRARYTPSFLPLSRLGVCVGV